MAQTVVNTNSAINKGGVVYLLCFFLLVTISRSQDLSHTVIKDARSPKYGQIFIEGLSSTTIDLLKARELTEKQWSSFFNIKVEDASRPIIGSYQVSSTQISFNPRFLPDQEVWYVITFSNQKLGELLEDHVTKGELSWRVRFNEIGEVVNRVVDLFPQSEQLPSNVLRFYVHFANPVDFQNPHNYIRIENSESEIVSGPFVEMEEGLWSSDRRRLTLLIHPGRIKRNVGPNMTIGEVFKEGESYRLVVSAKWNLEEDYTKTFKIVDAVRTTIDVDAWTVRAPAYGTLADLAIGTRKLLDKALSERLVSIINEDENIVEGQFLYDSEKSTLSFTPAKKWPTGTYWINVDPRLEDVCGNTPLSVFDVEGEGSKIRADKIQVKFEVEN